MRPKILFFAEAVTSAHLFRPLWFANKFADLGYDVHLASTQMHPILDDFKNISVHKLTGSLTHQDFIDNIKNGKLPFTKTIIQNNILQDSDLIEKIQPDIVMDDFRLSLSITTEQLKLPHITLNNITWSPFYEKGTDVLPEINIVKYLGEKHSLFLFNKFKKYYEDKIISPFNFFRKKNNLRQIQTLSELYTSGSTVGYLDIQDLSPETTLPNKHHFLGPLLFSYPLSMPCWWHKLDRSKPWVYISMGSSGRSDLIPFFIKAFEHSECEIIISTSGKTLKLKLPAHIHWAPYLPDDQILPHCQLYIGNGGSGGAQQALANQTPILALPENYDQWLYTKMLQALGLADILRPSTMNKKLLLEKVNELLLYPPSQLIRKKISARLKSEDTFEGLLILLTNTLNSNIETAIGE